MQHFAHLTKSNRLPTGPWSGLVMFYIPTVRQMTTTPKSVTNTQKWKASYLSFMSIDSVDFKYCDILLLIICIKWCHLQVITWHWDYSILLRFTFSSPWSEEKNIWGNFILKKVHKKSFSGDGCKMCGVSLRMVPKVFLASGNGSLGILVKLESGIQSQNK